MAAPLPDGVTWSQDDESVEVVIAVPESVVRGDLRVKTTADSLSVHVKDGTAVRPVLVGSLRHDVERESCCWALESRRKGGKVVDSYEAGETNGKGTGNDPAEPDYVF